MPKNKRGAKPRYENKEELQRMIDKYFDDCAGKPLTDEDGAVMRDKNGEPVLTDKRPPTITGLALALGFASRQALLNYQAKAEFHDTVTRAKARVEQYAEERLFDKDGANGAKFSLANNFDGWREKQHIEADVNQDLTINIELSDE